ncbi:MAG TPA: LuxR C-terminal-related transcriptional regulator [Solirubrobacteraceae bacterium]|jgi:DNA-binding CsgD family transcriptional regulator|nr:LuxR C-terminal-related transcriptional regulator [Solirubrobacteraceae bacterium]
MAATSDATLQARTRAALRDQGVAADGDLRVALAGASDALRERIGARPGTEQAAHDCRALLELTELREELAERSLQDRLRALTRIHDALGRLRALGSVTGLIERTPRVLAEACGFDRTVVFRVDGAVLRAESFHVAGDPERAQELLEFSRAHPAQLREQILEREMIRRRTAMVVRDAMNHPHTYKPLVRPYGTYAYVAAPVMPQGRVIGFLHADKGLQRPEDPDAVDELDRDALWAFAEGFGYALERMQLVERLRAQGEQVRRLMAQADTLVSEWVDARIELVAEPGEGLAASRAAAALLPEPARALERVLSRRELEVLALVASGATNGQIADRLVITEGTAKAHVKRILRKLGAGNRVEAATHYLRAMGPGPSDLRAMGPGPSA